MFLTTSFWTIKNGPLTPSQCHLDKKNQLTDINIIYYFLHNDVLMFFHLVLPEIVKF